MSLTRGFAAEVTIPIRVKKVIERLGESRTDPIENTCKLATNSTLDEN